MIWPYNKVVIKNKENLAKPPWWNIRKFLFSWWEPEIQPLLQKQNIETCWRKVKILENKHWTLATVIYIQPIYTMGGGTPLFNPRRGMHLDFCTKMMHSNFCKKICTRTFAFDCTKSRLEPNDPIGCLLPQNMILG